MKMSHILSIAAAATVFALCVAISYYFYWYDAGYRFIPRNPQAVEVPVIEVYSRDMGERDIFMQGGIIHSDWVLERYREAYGFTFDEEIDFEEELLLSVSRHRVKSLSYDERNQRHTRGRYNVLDIVFYKEASNNFYVYRIPAGLITREFTRIDRDPVFEE